jgi:hypothetical protein
VAENIANSLPRRFAETGHLNELNDRGRGSDLIQKDGLAKDDQKGIPHRQNPLPVTNLRRGP